MIAKWLMTLSALAHDCCGELIKDETTDYYSSRDAFQHDILQTLHYTAVSALQSSATWTGGPAKGESM